MSRRPITTNQSNGDASTAGGIARMSSCAKAEPSTCPNGAAISSEDPRNHPSPEGSIDMNKTVGKESPMKLVLCGCGKLHLTYGPVTLHLTRDEFLVFADSVRRLAAIVAQPPMSPPLVAAPASPNEVCH